MALRISPELPAHSASNTAWSGTHILPQLCLELWENILKKTQKLIKTQKQRIVRLLTFPASRLEMRLSTFIIVVGATGLKLETGENTQCWGKSSYCDAVFKKDLCAKQDAVTRCDCWKWQHHVMLANRLHVRHKDHMTSFQVNFSVLNMEAKLGLKIPSGSVSGSFIDIFNHIFYVVLSFVFV